MILKRLCFLMLVIGLIALPCGASQQVTHASSSSALHKAVQAHAAKVADARQHITDLLDHPAVPAQVRIKVALLSDVEILNLQHQIMPLEEQLKAAGMEEKYLIPLLAGISAGLALTMFMFAY